MQTVANILVGIVAALHLYFMVLEMFLWTGPKGRELSGYDAATAEQTKGLAANQGLYNGFVAAGLIWSLFAADPISYAVQVCFLIFVVIAGIFGGLTASRRILIAQATPGAIALILVIIAA